MAYDTLVFAVAASYIRHHGETAADALREEAEIAEGRGDHAAAAIWLEIAAMADELISQPLAS